MVGLKCGEASERQGRRSFRACVRKRQQTPSTSKAAALAPWMNRRLCLSPRRTILQERRPQTTERVDRPTENRALQALCSAGCARAKSRSDANEGDLTRAQCQVQALALPVGSDQDDGQRK